MLKTPALGRGALRLTIGAGPWAPYACKPQWERLYLICAANTFIYYGILLLRHDRNVSLADVSAMRQAGFAINEPKVSSRPLQE